MSESHRPYTLVAELTHRCPLACPYCSNPRSLVSGTNELSTDIWARTFEQAEAIGVVQLHLTGGEPLARADLETLVEKAHASSLYTQLVTSGIPLSRERLSRLRSAGLDAIQLSVQGADANSADAIAGYKAHERKLEVARWAKELDLPLTINVVIHRQNADQITHIIGLAETLRADRIEIANAQYAGWAHENRSALIPTDAQIANGRQVALAARERLRGRVEVVYVTPDYFSTKPKACMDGWGRRYIHVTPDGLVLPCQGAREIPGLDFWNLRDFDLSKIWASSPGLIRFRGEDWMREPCRSCDRRGVDFGGCRCQAFALTGEAANTDPTCSLSPHHGAIRAERAKVAPIRFVHRGRSS